MKYKIRVEHDSDEYVLLKLHLNETGQPLLYEAIWSQRKCCLIVNGEIRANHITNEKDSRRALITQYERMMNKEDRSTREEISEMCEESAEIGGVEAPKPERPDLDNVSGATHWAMSPNGEKLIYRITDTIEMWSPYSNVWFAPSTVPYTLHSFDDDVVQITTVDPKDFGAVPDSKPALTTQVGGSHYKDMPIQPAEYCHKNGIGKLEGDVIAYVSRWRKKNGIEDLKKARHTIDIILELEGGETHHG